MPTLAAKKAMILDYELRFANELGLAVMPKPKVKLWMMLIPMYFVFHMFRNKKYLQGRRVFSANFMTSRRWVADETAEALGQNRPANLDAVCAKAKLSSEEAQLQYREWLAALMVHYRELLTAQADDFAGLIKQAYRSRSDYLLILDRLNEAEKALNAALRPHVKKKVEDIDDLIAAIESHSAALRRAHAQAVFP